MKKILFLFLSYTSLIQQSFADGWVLWLSESKIRNGDIHIDDIPVALKNAINFFMGIAGTIAVIFVIVWAYKLLFGSLEQDKTKGRDTIVAALGGFVLAGLAWFIIRFIISNFS